MALLVALWVGGQGADAQMVPAPPPSERLQERWLWELRHGGGAPQLPPTDNRRNAMNRLLSTAPAPPGTISPPGYWQNIGPAPILGGQVGLRGREREVTGRVAAIAVDPDNANHWLVGAASGGIWGTRDAGRSWTPLTDDQCSLWTGAIAFGPRRNGKRVVYAGTGEATGSTNVYGGQGMLKSVDGGLTWRPLLETGQTDEPCPVSRFAGLTFARVRVDLHDADKLVVATREAPAAFARETASSTGILSSTDGGRSWTRLLPCIVGPDPSSKKGEASALEVNPADSSQMYAGLLRTDPDTPTGVYRKRGGAGCAAWERLGRAHGLPDVGTRTGRIEMALGPPRRCPQDRHRSCSVLYVAITRASGPLNGLLGLWRTDDAWAPHPRFEKVPFEATDGGSGQWGYCGAHPSIGVQQMDDRQFSGQCHYSHTLTIDPCHPDDFYAGGIGLWKAHVTRRDGTNTYEWTEVSQITSSAAVPRIRGRGIHVDQQAMAWAGCRLIVGNDGGLWSTSDRGGLWSNHNHGLSIVQFYSGALTENGSDVMIMGGTQDNGTVRWTGSTWEFVKGGDAGRPLISSDHPTTQWVLSYLSVLDGRTVQRTLDGGKEFARVESPLSITARRNYFPGLPLAKCGHSDDLALAGADRVYKTSALFGIAAPTWEDAKIASGTITAFAVHASCRTIAVAFDDGSVSVWNDDTPPPSQKDGWPPPPLTCLNPPGTPVSLPQFSRKVMGLAFEPRAPFRLYATLAEPDPKRRDDGFSRIVRIHPCAPEPAWEDLASIVDAEHSAIAIKPDPRDATSMHVLVATEVGVVWGRCGQAKGECAWERHGFKDRGMPNVQVSDIQVDARGGVVAFTFGRGVFVFREGAGPCGGDHARHVGTTFVKCP